MKDELDNVFEELWSELLELREGYYDAIEKDWKILTEDRAWHIARIVREIRVIEKKMGLD